MRKSSEQACLLTMDKYDSVNIGELFNQLFATFFPDAALRCSDPAVNPLSRGQSEPNKAEQRASNWTS